MNNPSATVIDSDSAASSASDHHRLRATFAHVLRSIQHGRLIMNGAAKQAFCLVMIRLHNRRMAGDPDGEHLGIRIQHGARFVVALPNARES